MREVNAAISYPVVSGELEFSRYGFAELLREDAIENGLWAEYFHRDPDVKVFDNVIEDPLEPEDCALEHPDRPGHGTSLSRDALAEFEL